MIDLEDYGTQPHEYEEMERERIIKIIENWNDRLCWCNRRSDIDNLISRINDKEKKDEL